jgi:hypothetical protein
MTKLTQETLHKALALANRYCQAHRSERGQLLAQIHLLIGKGNKIPLTVLNAMGEDVTWNSPVRFVP